VEDDVWIGSNCVLLDGAILRQGSVVGAGMIIRDEIPEYSIYAGNPARLIGWRK
jgi:acetyltransferase-like isoleucine patch superfamily enzyme